MRWVSVDYGKLYALLANDGEVIDTVTYNSMSKFYIVESNNKRYLKLEDAQDATYTCHFRKGKS